MESNRNEIWAAERLASIQQAWSPDLARGRALLDTRLDARSRSWGWFAVPAAVAICALVLANPSARGFAQDLWYRFVLNRVDVVRLDLSKAPLHARVTTNGLEEDVSNLQEAEEIAGFLPHLPSPAVLSGNPVLTVTGPISIEQTIQVSEIESALARVGLSDVQVPEEWNGLQLHTKIGPIVTANYPGDVLIQQELTMELSIPSGFPLQQFAEVIFESMGTPRWKAEAMARRFANHPAWLLDIPPDEVVNLHELKLSNGPAFLMDEYDRSGAMKQATVIRCTDERIYSVSSPSGELSTKIAGDLP